jgi:hypothetical protein
MYSLTLDNLYNIVKNLDQALYCSQTQDALYTKICGDSNYAIKSHDYQDYYQYRNKISYDDYIINPIVDELKNKKYCFLSISNNSTVNVTYGHHFTLFLIDDIVYRVESYGVITYKLIDNIRYVDKDELIYAPRYLELGTILDFDREFRKLLTCNVDERLEIWNNMFSCQEERDTCYPYLEVEIKINKY